MLTVHDSIKVRTQGRKTYDITREVEAKVRASGVMSGLCTLFVRHCSASLMINEGADPSVQRDLWRFFNRLAPDNDPSYEHDYEGADDMPAHIKAAILPVSLTIPVVNGDLVLGTWQSIFLFEHRIHSHSRHIHVTVLGT